jgi:predicted outer membrane protein
VRLFLKDSANHSIVALGLLLLTGPALAQSVGEKTGVNSALGISPTTADFVKEVAMSDMFEVESNTLAQDKGNALEKKFAAQMVTDHTKTSTELKSLVSSGKVKAELPVALDGSHQGKLDKLRDAGGKGFQLGFRFDAGQRAQGRGVAVRALFKAWRQCGPEELGRKDAARAEASSQDGAGPEEMMARQ